MFQRFSFALLMFALSAATFCSAAEEKIEAKKKETANLHVEVRGEGKPVRGVGVFARTDNEEWSGEETTNSKGMVSFTKVPRGKVLIQINEKEWKNCGVYFNLGKAEETLRVTLEKKEERAKTEAGERK
jgi:hypothetical protein